MQKVDKEKIWQEVYEKLQKSEAVFVVNYQGIKVESMNELRRSLKNAQGEIKVVKNTLARIALDKAGIPYMMTHERAKRLCFFLSGCGTNSEVIGRCW